MPSNCLGSLGGPSDLQLAAQAAQGPAQSSADAPSADTRNPFQKAMDAISDVANSANQFLYKATVTEPARMLDAAGNAVKDALHNDIVQDSLAIGMVALSGFKEDEGAARSQVQGLVEEASPNVGSQVYRLFGDASDLGANGGSWTTQNPAMMSNARDTLGLPASNSAEFLATGRIADMAGAIVRAALSLDGNRGGGVEVKGAKVLVETVHSFGQ
jgi:hypothetical protein